MSRPKRHHFVPRWYLEHFVDKLGYLHLYDRRRNMWRRQKPKQVMTINHYYRQEWAPKGIDPDIIERLLGSRLEPQGQQATIKIITRTADITDDDMAAMLAYLEFQRIRVPRQADVAKEVLQTALRMRAEQRQTVNAVPHGALKVEINDAFRFRMMKIQLGKLFLWFGRMEWVTLEAPLGSAFITSDSPVSFFNSDFPPPAEAGLGLAGTMVLFPLSSRQLLLLRHPESGQNGVSASTLLPEPDLARDHLSLTYGGVCSDAQVQMFNETVFALSDYLIAGESKEILEKCVGQPLKGH